MIRELVLEEDRKVVVFSEYERMTHLAGQALAKLGIGFVSLAWRRSVTKTRGA